MISPSEALAIVGFAGLAPSAAVLALRDQDARRWASHLDAYRIEVPTNFETAWVGQFLGSMTGLLPARWERPVSVRGIGFEVVSDATGITHYLLVPSHQKGIVLGQLRGSMPGVRATHDPAYSVLRPTLAGELQTVRPNHQLEVDNSDGVASGILAGLTGLSDSESIVVQWILLPTMHSASQTSDLISNFLAPADAHQVKPTNKELTPQFTATCRLGVRSSSAARDRQLLAQVTAAFHNANSSDASMRRRRVSSRQVARAITTRRPPVVGRPCWLNTSEFSGLFALPPKGFVGPGITRVGSRQLAPASDIPTTGVVIGDSNFPGLRRPIALSIEGSLQHAQIIGPPGVGKTSLMISMATQVMEAGFGLIFIDPKSDGVTDLLDRIPSSRQRQVTVLDALDDKPIGVNILQGDDDPDLRAEQVYSVIHKLNRDSWGPRLADLLRTGLHTLARTPGATLCELPNLYLDANYRARVVGSLDDPLGIGSGWAQFDSWSEAERSAAVSPILNKTRPWVAREKLRHVLGQAEPPLDIDAVLEDGRILLVPLSSGELGEDAAALLGAVVMAKISQAIMRRVRLPHYERQPVFLFVDEAQMLTTLPTPIPDLLAMARAMGLSVILGHQSLAQFDRDLREAVLSTTRSRIIFQTAAADATRLAKELSPHLSPEDLRGLGPYEFAATLSTGQRVAPPITGKTRPLAPGNGQANLVRELSRQRWGRNRDEIEAELRRRLERPTGSGPVGRQRRSK